MDSDYINKLTSKRVPWLKDSGPDDDIAISSRIRLARNLQGFKFPVIADKPTLNNVVHAVASALQSTKSIDNIIQLNMHELSQLDADFLLERRLLSREFSLRKDNTCLFMNEQENMAIMVNEEDHLRLHCIMPGFQFNKIWEKINKLDSELSTELPYCFDSKIGFLTSCPSNVGTGMRASVMLHLPGLAIAGFSDSLIQGVFKLGMVVRGILGEGSDNLGNLFQVSNQSTLGESENEIIKRLSTLVSQIITHEKNARLKLQESNKNILLDNIGRAYGTLKYSYILSTKDALQSLSMLRLGVDLGVIRSIDIHTVNELFITIQPAHLQKFSDLEMDSEERDQIRARFVRETIQKAMVK
jgi:protein arginine kinase